jgi:hypothetical protein
MPNSFLGADQFGFIAGSIISGDNTFISEGGSSTNFGFISNGSGGVVLVYYLVTESNDNITTESNDPIILE